MGACRTPPADITKIEIDDLILESKKHIKSQKGKEYETKAIKSVGQQIANLMQDCTSYLSNVETRPFHLYIRINSDGIPSDLVVYPTNALRACFKREWTYYVVAIPFNAMIAASIVESTCTQPSEAAVIAGSFLAAVGVIIRIRGHMELNGAFSQYVEKSAEQKLVQAGMYRKIRHPMLTFNILKINGYTKNGVEIPIVKQNFLLC